MSDACSIRVAQRTDLDALLALESACFSSDRISARSFRRFIKAEHSQLLVLESAAALVGYILLLYRSGTNLARIYSLAVDPQQRGKGFARALLTAAEQAAAERNTAFIRLEVDARNSAALALYSSLHYHRFGLIAGYYQDGGDALRMEKSLRRRARPPVVSPYYAQTTPFTCGPASLLMAMARLEPGRAMTRSEELELWRESTTIYMTSGHGGCSPLGLALAAQKRGFKAELYLSTSDTPFVDSVRDLDKKAVIEQVHQDYLSAMQQQGIVLHYETLSSEQLTSALQSGKVALCLISTWRLNRNRAPHWVLASAADSRYLYICDPDHDSDDWHPESDYADVPIAQQDYATMARYGRQRLSATLLVSSG